jgi:autophagy-related protein 101
VRQLDADRNQPHHHHHHQSQQQHSNNGSGRGQIVVQFYERRRRKTSGWYPLRGGEEEVCWESWTVKVTVAEPRTESGEFSVLFCVDPWDAFVVLWKIEGQVANSATERAKVRKAMESTLLATVMKIVTYVNTHKDHIPPITTTESNPFPYQIHVNQKEASWATRMGIY